MSNFTIYPAIDLRNGKVVRLKEGDPARMKTYGNDPSETARGWFEMGARWLHVVNLDGALDESDSKNHAALRSILGITKEFGTRVQFGGGLRSMDAIARALDLGVSRVVLGTIAIEEPELIKKALRRFGAEKIAVGIDARNGLVRVHGWQSNSGISATNLACQMQTLGIYTVIFTDVSRDGMGRGLNIAATRALADIGGLDVIASGGVHILNDVLAAQEANLSGVIVGSALYEGTIDLADALKGVADARKTDHSLS